MSRWDYESVGLWVWESGKGLQEIRCWTIT